MKDTTTSNMKFVLILLLAISSVCSFSTGRDAFSELSAKYADLIPSELSTSLSDKDKQVLKDVFKNIKDYKDEKDLIKALAQKSPELGKKAGEFYAKITKKIAGLSENPRKFAQQVIKGIKSVHGKYVAGEPIDLAALKQLALKQVEEFNKLKPEEKEELKKAFPKISALLSSDKLKKLFN